MSTPWLSDDFKKSSKSRSNSPDEKTKVDEFGRTVPVKSKSRSRSRSRERRRLSSNRNRGRLSKDRYRNESREQGRREERPFKRRRRRSGSDSSDNDMVRPAASNNPKYKNARLFVANLNCNNIRKGDLMELFEKYGEVIDVLVHPKNYAFIQYKKEEQARSAVEGENGTIFKEHKLHVKMANEGKRESGPASASYGKGRKDEPHGRANERDRPVPRDEPFKEDFRPDSHRYPPPRFPREQGSRDPYYPPPDPYPNFPDPWYHGPGDPYRMDPYLDPYRDTYTPRAPVSAPPPKIECQIFVVSPKLKAYGETIENRIKEHCIITAVTVMPEGETASQLLESFVERDGLFAVFVNAQNEVHRSLTLNILHGTPQEHRNMPMNDAVALVGRSFEEYVDTLREKANAAKTSGAESPAKTTAAATTSQSFLAASSDVAYLLNLLADNQALTVSELNNVIEYLKQRRTKMMEAERKYQASNEPISAKPEEQSKSSEMPSTEELTKKILSIFSSAGGTLQGLIPNAMQDQQQPPPQTQPPPPPPPPPANQSQPQSQMQTQTPGSNVINFDNPNVQKALDQLIQSSPVLRQSFSVSSEKAPAPSIENVSRMVGRSSMMGYGHTQTSELGVDGDEMQQDSHQLSRAQGHVNSRHPQHHHQHY